MLLRRILVSRCDLCKLTRKPRSLLTLRSSSISNDVVVTSTQHESEEDFFGITENDLPKKGENLLSSGRSTKKDDLPRDTIISKHLPSDVGRNDMEKYISTKFGKIRFDYQNRASPRVKETPSIKTNNTHRSDSGMDFISEMYFGEDLSKTSENITPPQMKDSPSVYSKDSHRSDSGMDYFSETYFGNDFSETSGSTHHPQAREIPSLNSKESRQSNGDMDYFSEKYFGDNLGETSENIAPPSLREIPPVKTKDSHQSNSGMDYISEMYFGDDLGESPKNSITPTAINSNKSTDKIGDFNPGHDTKDEMDFVNSQYFGNYEENINNNAHSPNLSNLISKPANLVDTFPHDRLQQFNEKNKSYEVDFSSDNDFIESQYFDHLGNYETQVKNDSHAPTNKQKANLFPDAKGKHDSDLAESNSSADSFGNEFRVPNIESSQTRQNPNRKPENAYEASQEIRRDLRSENKGQLVDSKGFRILKDQVNDLSHLTTYEIANHLKSRILYNKNDIIVIDKPYGLPSHGGPGINVSIAKALPELAKKLDHSGDVHLIHRLDKETTGVMLLGKTDKMAHTLKDMFKERQVIKTYWALTKGIPNPLRGVIDIPIAEGTVEGKHRMVLRPEYDEKGFAMKRSRVKSQQAITHYHVMNSNFNCALVECKAETGIKHQVRVHLAFGLNTPILGDHKYSHLNKLAPQRLYPEVLDRLHIRQSKVRHLPMHLHAHSIILPEVIDGQNLIFKAPPPYHFRKNMKSLKIRKYDSKKSSQ